MKPFLLIDGRPHRTMCLWLLIIGFSAQNTLNVQLYSEFIFCITNAHRIILASPVQITLDKGPF